MYSHDPTTSTVTVTSIHLYDSKRSAHARLPALPLSPPPLLYLGARSSTCAYADPPSNCSSSKFTTVHKTRHTIPTSSSRSCILARDRSPLQQGGRGVGREEGRGFGGVREERGRKGSRKARAKDKASRNRFRGQGCLAPDHALCDAHLCPCLINSRDRALSEPFCPCDLHIHSWSPVASSHQRPSFIPHWQPFLLLPFMVQNPTCPTSFPGPRNRSSHSRHKRSQNTPSPNMIQ